MKKNVAFKYAILPVALVLLLTTSVLIYSCTKSSSSTSSVTTVDQDKQFITSSFNSTSACISDIIKGNGAQSLITFFVTIQPH